MASKKSTSKAQLLEELVIKVNSRALKQATRDQEQLGERMMDSAEGAELLNEQLQYTNIQLTEARKLSRGLANSLENIGSDANMADYFDGVVQAIQEVEGVIGELTTEFEKYATIARQGNDEVVITLERLLDPLRKVDKQTGKTAASVKDLGSKISDVEPAANKASKGIEGMNRKSKNATRSFQDLAKIAGPLPTLYAVIAANVYALTSAYEQLAAGDRLNRLEKINKVIGSEQGVQLSSLADIMQEATGYAIGFESAMLKASQASAYGFSPDQVEQFTLAARRASVALGVDLDDQMNRVIRGVSKLEIELLDELGITVRLNEAYDKYAKSLGVTAASLSGYQKQQAYANAVIQESTQRFGYLDKQMRATGWERLSAEIDQATKSGQKWLASFLEPAASAVASGLATTDTDKFVEKLDNLRKSQTEQYNKGNMQQVYKLQIDDKGLQQSRDKYQLMQQELAQQKKVYDSEDASIAQKIDQALSINRLTQDMKSLTQSIAAQDAEYKRIVGSQSKFKAGSQEQQRAQIEARNQFESTRASLKESGEIMQGFAINNKLPELQIEKPLDSLNNAINAAKQQQKVMQNQRLGSNEQEQAAKSMEQIFKTNNVSSMDELVKKQQQFAEVTENAKNQVRTTQIDSQTIQKNLQYTAGEGAQLQENARQRAENEKIIANQTFTQKDGTETLLYTEKEVLDAKQENIKLEAQRRDLIKQSNQQAYEHRDALQQSQAIQQILNNQDPLRTQLQLEEKRLENLKQINAQNQGMMKPEEQQQGQLEEVKQLESIRSLKQQIQERTNQIAMSSAEIAKQEFLISSLSTVKNQESQAEITFLERSIKIYEQKLKTAKEYGATEQEILAIQQEQNDQAIALQKARQDALEKRMQAQEDEVTLRGKEMGLSELDVLNEQVRVKQEFIQQLAKEGAAYDTIIKQQQELRDLQVEQANARKAESVKGLNLGLGALQSQGSVPTIQAPTQVGDQQLKDQQLQTSMDAINKSFSELSSYNPAMSDMIANVSNLGLAFHQMGEGAQTGQQVAAQGMSTVASMLNYAAQQTISGYDEQIAAEKQRDGKSAESLKKIQKLEAEKAQQQKKAATQQIVMQTAMGITQALASLPPPISYAMAATTQLMGMAALKSQQSGSSVPSVSEGSVPSLSLGERDNRIDVSKSASAGELAYIQGGNGVGNASNFKPRQVGNRAPANHSVMVGENGAEVVSFDTPATITQQNKVSSGGGTGGNVFVIQAMDQESFEAFLAKNSDILSGTLEHKLNSTGNSLFRN